MPRDDTSTVTLDIDLDDTPTSKGKKPLSADKLQQLAHARAKSLEVRRRAQANKLQGKLNHLRYVLGNDMRPDTVERFAKELINTEERLRAKQNALTEMLKDSITGFRDELRAIRKLVDKGRTHTSLSDLKPKTTASSSKRPASDVTTSSYRRA